MKSAAMAPLIAAGRRAWAAPTAENVQSFVKIAPIPETALEAVLTQAGQDVPGVDLAKLELVARALWNHFQFGLGKVGVWSDVELLQVMYTEPGTTTPVKTGVIVADNVDKFDPFGNDYQTNVCAYLCGHKAAKAALTASPPKDKIDGAIYKAARAETEQEMKIKLNKARAGEPPPSSGAGC
jgi:hypothetical protein